MALQLAERIAARVRAGAYQPGENLRETALADDFGVSRSSIREAFRILERDGVLRIEPRRGASVTRLNTDELVEVFQVRAVLLGLALGRFAQSRDATQLAWFEARLAEMLGCESVDHDRIAQCHADVSARMARYAFEAARNQLLADLLSRMSMQIFRYTVIGLSAPKRRQRSREHWTRIVAAVRDQDARTAEKLGRQLVNENLAFALSQLAGR